MSERFKVVLDHMQGAIQVLGFTLSFH